MGRAKSWKAVLTGDIIRSSNLPPERRAALYSTFADLSALLRLNYPEDVPYDISNFRGDSWQAVCLHPEHALEVGVFIRSYLQFSFKEEKLDTRFAIGVGNVNFIPPENVSAGDGEAYTLSGNLLDSLSSERMAAAFPPGESEVQAAAEGMISLLDFITSGWSASQSQAVFWALHGIKQQEIAARWKPNPITQASVSTILKAAGWAQVRKSLSAFETLISSAIQGKKD